MWLGVRLEPHPYHSPRLETLSRSRCGRGEEVWEPRALSTAVAPLHRTWRTRLGCAFLAVCSGLGVPSGSSTPRLRERLGRSR